MRKLSTRGVCALGLLVSACLGCFAPPIEPTRQLTGEDWVLTHLSGTAVTIANSQKQPTMRLEASGEMTGMAGCNRMFGKFQGEGDKIAFAGIGTTKMFCPEGMDIEGKMLEALESAARFKVVADTLELLDDSSGRLARFVVTGN